MYTYRITLFKDANGTSKEITILAAQSNSEEEQISFAEMMEYFEIEKKRYPTTNADLKCFVTDHYLFIMRETVKGWDKVLLIERVEIIGQITYPEINPLSDEEMRELLN